MTEIILLLSGRGAHPGGGVTAWTFKSDVTDSGWLTDYTPSRRGRYPHRRRG